MQITDFLGVIDTGDTKKLYSKPVVVAKVTGDVYAAIDTETGDVKYYPFWASMTKFNVGGFFVVTLADQIPDKVKSMAEKVIAKAKPDERYKMAVRTVEEDKRKEGNMVEADTRLLKEAWRTYNRYESQGLIDGKKYTNCF